MRLGDNGTLVLKCHAGCEPKDIFREIKNRNLLPDNYYERRKIGPIGSKRNNFTSTVETPKKPHENYNKIRAQEFWKGSVAPQNTLVETYLRSRSIHTRIPTSLRFLPSHDYYDGGRVLSSHPCMVAKITVWPSNEVIAIHRTYLRDDGLGKADVPAPKKTLAPVSGGAIRFGDGLEVLAIGEGIETCLSYYQETGVTTWAVLSASNFKSVVLPPVSTNKEIIILADNDIAGTGIKAATEAAKRYVKEGRAVHSIKPMKDGQDFNDLLVGGNND
jgi:hypothetical protein